MIMIIIEQHTTQTNQIIKYYDKKNQIKNINIIQKPPTQNAQRQVTHGYI